MPKPRPPLPSPPSLSPDAVAPSPQAAVPDQLGVPAPVAVVADDSAGTSAEAGPAAPAGDAGDDPAPVKRPWPKFVPYSAAAAGIIDASDALQLSDEDDLGFDLEDPFRSEDPATQTRLQRMLDEPFGYIAGDAGTGKSYLARRFAELYQGSELLATTGIAAVNIGGTTINSCLRYFDTESMQLEYELGRIGAAIRVLGAAGTTRLVIDEISMMEGQQLEILGLAVDDANAWLHSQGKPLVGVWLTGDFAQLPPVGVDNKKNRDAKYPVKYAFRAANWSRWGDNQIQLTEIRRQADPDFIRAIQQVRKGDKSCVDYFRQFISPKEVNEFEGTTILAKNDEVDRYNRLRMLRLQTPSATYQSHRTGAEKDRPKEWKHIPETLELKPECLVMILANRTEQESRELIYANGDLAIFNEKVGPHHASVTLLRTQQEVTVTNIIRERLKPEFRKFKKKPGEPTPPEKLLATIDYMPLRVAYASTVHKSQGLSLDNVQVMINSQFWMASGMLYVGLSRARTPQGLRIVGTADQFVARVRANPLVAAWL